MKNPALAAVALGAALALAACRSDDSTASTEAAPTAPIEESAAPQTAAAAKLPEIRYYEIADT